MMAVVRPPVEFVGAHRDHWELGRMANGKQIFMEATVQHVAEGSLAGGIEWVNMSAAQHAAAGAPGVGSWNYMVGKSGRVVQAVSTNDTPYFHGEISRPKAKLVWDNGWTDELKYGSPGFVSPNKWAGGVEREGIHQDRPTKVQLDVMAVVHAMIWEDQIVAFADKTGAVLDFDHLLGHNEINADNRANCPSLLREEWDYLLNGIKAALGSSQPEPVPSVDWIERYSAELEGYRQKNVEDLKALNDLFTKFHKSLDDTYGTLLGRIQYSDSVLTAKLQEVNKLRGA